MEELKKQLKKMTKDDLINSIINISEDLKKLNQTINNQKQKIKSLENKFQSEHFNLEIGDKVFVMCKNYRIYKGYITLDTNLFLKIRVKNKENKEWEYVLAKTDIVAVKTYYEEEEDFGVNN